MKRDMDLVRRILIDVEAADGPIAYNALADSKTSLQAVVYHVELMAAHGLLDAKTEYAVGKQGRFARDGVVHGLTWDGHDYLEAIRNDGIWSRTKEVVKDTVGSTTVDTIKKTAVWLTEQAIRANLGL